VRVLTAYTIRTKTGTAPKNGSRDPKKGSAASGDDREVSEWRPHPVVPHLPLFAAR